MSSIKDESKILVQTPHQDSLLTKDHIEASLPEDDYSQRDTKYFNSV